MSLPSAHDINPYEDLDGNRAQQHFLGASPDDAVHLFEDNFDYYQEDLMFMGPTAFCFYFSAAVQYIDLRTGQGRTTKNTKSTKNPATVW